MYPELIHSRIFRLLLKIIFDAVAILIAVIVSYSIHYNTFIINYNNTPQLSTTIIFLIISTIIFGTIFGLYRQLWHYTSLNEVMLVIAVAIINTVILLSLTLTKNLIVPIGIIINCTIFSMFLLIGIRAARRVQFRSFDRFLSSNAYVQKITTIVIGAGNAANRLLQGADGRKFNNWEIVGLLDDSPTKQGGTLRGFKILGPTTALEKYVRLYTVELIIIAMPSAKPEIISNILRFSEINNVNIKFLPNVNDQLFSKNGNEISAGRISIADLKDAEEIRKSFLPDLIFNKNPYSVLITGGAGYIGSHLTRMYLEEGFAVTILDNFTYGSKGIDDIKNHKNLNVINGDIANIRDVTSAVKGVNNVVALAAIVGDPACSLDAEETLNLNYESTKLLVEACDFYGIERLIFASSCSVYGDSGDRILNELSPVNPLSLYSRTRVFSEDYLFNNCRNVIPVILRLATVFGYSQRLRYDLVINTLTAHGLINGKITITGGSQWRPFIHCIDAARAFYLASTIEKNVVGKQIFNVGSDNLNFTINQIADIIAEVIGDVVIEKNDHLIDKRNYRVSFNKIKEIFNYNPKYDIKNGVIELIRNMQLDKNLQDISNPIFSNVEYLKSIS